MFSCGVSYFIALWVFWGVASLSYQRRDVVFLMGNEVSFLIYCLG